MPFSLASCASTWAESAGEQLSITAVVLVIAYFVFLHVRSRGLRTTGTQGLTD